MTSAADPPGLADAEAIRTTVLACDEVAALSPGPFGEVASYFSGRRVPGVRIDEARVEVHVVAYYGVPLPKLADKLGELLARLLAGRRLQVTVTDMVMPGETLSADISVEGDAGGQ